MFNWTKKLIRSEYFNSDSMPPETMIAIHKNFWENGSAQYLVCFRDLIREFDFSDMSKVEKHPRSFNLFGGGTSNTVFLFERTSSNEKKFDHKKSSDLCKAAFEFFQKDLGQQKDEMKVQIRAAWDRLKVKRNRKQDIKYTPPMPSTSSKTKKKRKYKSKA